MSMVIYTLYTQGPRFVESHISRKTSEIPGIGYGTGREKFRLVDRLLARGRRHLKDGPCYHFRLVNENHVSAMPGNDVFTSVR
jgi:hypothetical protein